MTRLYGGERIGGFYCRAVSYSGRFELPGLLPCRSKHKSYNRKPCLSSPLVSSPLGLDISLEIILWSYSLSPKSQVSVTDLVSFPLNFIVGRVVNFWLEMQGRQLCRPGPGNWMGGKHINPGVAPLEPTSSWPEFDLRESSWSPFVACS